MEKSLQPHGNIYSLFSPGADRHQWSIFLEPDLAILSLKSGCDLPTFGGSSLSQLSFGA